MTDVASKAGENMLDRRRKSRQMNSELESKSGLGVQDARNATGFEATQAEVKTPGGWRR